MLLLNGDPSVCDFEPPPGQFLFRRESLNVVLLYLFFLSFLFWENVAMLYVSCARLREKGSIVVVGRQKITRCAVDENLWRVVVVWKTEFLFGVCCNCQASCPIAREEAPLSLSPRGGRKKEKKKWSKKRNRNLSVSVVADCGCVLMRHHPSDFEPISRGNWISTVDISISSSDPLSSFSPAY